MVKIAVPGERWEVEFSENDVRIEKFESTGKLFDETELEVLFRNFAN